MRQSTKAHSRRFSPANVLIAMIVAVATSVAAAPAWAGKYAAIVVDANTGKTLFSSHAEEPRFPASLTKMMTLYMVFEAMQAGRINKQTRVPFSAHAAAQPPTKLGVRAGNSITVETAIYALVTKSANDAAAALGEMLGGSEMGFARLMTAKARQLGMRSTTFRNASGLPNGEQKTTARDMATLGIALREHYPQYYSYFSTRSFTFGKTRMGNHNKLLGRVKGVDGIKTGYIRASGFNLVSSVKTGGKSLVAVVMGGNTGASRDAHMAELIRKYLPKASTRDTGPVVAGRVVNKGGPVAIAGIALPKVDVPTPEFRPTPIEVVTAYADPEEAVTPTQAEAAEMVEEGIGQGDIDPVNTASTPSGGWVVQVASTPSKQQALSVLSQTSQRAGSILAGASPFTELFELKGNVYHRARFGGFTTKTAAFDACSALKKKRIDCYAVQQQ